MHTRLKGRLAKFLSYYKPYRGLLIADIACAALVALVALAHPLVVRYVTKDVLETGLTDALPRILAAGGVMLVLLALDAGGTFFYDYRGHSMGAMMERDMRAELFAHLQRLSISFHDGQNPGQLISRLTNDILSLAELYHHGPEDLIINSLKFVGAFIVLAGVSLRLTLIVFCFLPVIAAFSVIVGPWLNRAMRRNLESIGDVNAAVEENLSGIRVVQSFANEGLEIAKFAQENEQYLSSRKNIYRSESVFYVGVETLTKLISAAVVVFGGMAISGGTLDLADMLTFLLYVGYLVAPITRLAHTIQQYQQGIAGFHRFMDLLQTCPAVEDAADASDLGDVKGRVSFRGVGFHYAEGGEVLRDVSFDVEAGETVAIVGHSGVGKTTLCALIPRFYDVTQGAVYIDGMDVRSVTLSSLRQRIGVVQQDVYLFSGSVLENIRYGRPGAPMEDIIQAAKRANAHDFILALPRGYETDIGHRGVKLSGGEKQRLSIARAFLKDPPILILDEATSALDTESERVVRDSLEALARGRTTFIIAHRLSTVRGARRILVLSERGVAEQGTHAELLAGGGVYARLYAAQ